MARTFRLRPGRNCDLAQCQRSSQIDMQFGLDLKASDEVVTNLGTTYSMIASWQQRERRDGIVLRQLKFPVPPPGLDFLAKLVEDAYITPKTRVIHVCHITNRTGQIFPSENLPDEPRARHRSYY